MKKFTKIALILAVSFTIIGLVCVMVSMALGLTWRGFSNMINQGKFNFSFGDGIIYSTEKKSGTQTLEEEFQDLDIEFGAGELEVSYADVEKVQIKHEGVKGFECYTKKGTLYIRGNNNLLKSKTVGKLVVQFPKGTIFDEVDMEIGAGQATVKDLVAGSLDIEVGAGEARLLGLDVRELDAQTGAGELYAELVDSEKDYSYDAECGVGQIVIGASTIGGLGGSRDVKNPGAKRYMDLECGIGQIEIQFQK